MLIQKTKRTGVTGTSATLTRPYRTASQNTITFEEVATKLAEVPRDSHRSAEQLEDEIGFRIDKVQGTGEALWGYSVEAFYRVCRSVHVDWVQALPSLSTVRIIPT